jgi:hypothetical protein
MVAKSYETSSGSFINAMLIDLQLPVDLLFPTFVKIMNNRISSLRKDTYQTTNDYRGYSFDRFLSNNYEPNISSKILSDGIFYSEFDRVRQLYIGVVDSVYCLTGRCPSQKAMIEFVVRYFIYALQDKLENAYKFHTAYLVCELTGLSELPSRPDFIFEHDRSGVILGGWTRRFLQSSVKSNCEKIQMAMSLQNSKRAANAISLDKQEKAIIDHQRNMKGLGYNPKPNSEHYLDNIKDKVKKLTRYYYGGKRLDNEIPVWRTPSYSACFEESGLSGGSNSYIGSHFTLDEEIQYWDLLGYNNVPNFWNFDKKWTLDTLDKFENIKYTAHHYADIDYKEKIPIFSFGFDISDIRTKLNNEITYRALENRRTTCRYSMVLEPFKVRGVTMGESYVYQMGRLLQPVLHRHLRDENGPFRFIGKRHNVEDINNVYSGSILTNPDVFAGCVKYGCSLPFYRRMKTCLLAGDFTSATDNLHPDIPYTFIETCKEDSILSDLWIHVLEQTLDGHIIDYEQISSGKTGLTFENNPEFESKVTQEWGQLMGSPNSFTVLCIANGAALWSSIEIFEQRTVTWEYVIKEYRPLINGDDISCLTNSEHYKTWSAVCSAAGLSLSLGKNYLSTEFVNINSTNYFATDITHYDDGTYRLGDFKELFIVNPGLLKGQSKVLGGSGVDMNSLGSTCDQLEECIRIADDFQKARCYEVFEYHMTTKLQNSIRPWCLPRLFGGLGLPFGPKPTLAQWLVALKQLDEYHDLTDDSIEKVNNRAGNEYFKQICNLHDIEIIKPSIVRNDYKTIQDEHEPTLYQNPSLAPSFFLDTERRSFARFAKNFLFKKNKKRSANSYFYDRIFDPKTSSKDKAFFKKKLRDNYKKSQKSLSEIEQRRYNHSIQAERTYYNYLQKMQKLVDSMDKENVINVPDDYQTYFSNYILKKGGCTSEICIDVSKSLKIFN